LHHVVRGFENSGMQLQMLPLPGTILYDLLCILIVSVNTIVTCFPKLVPVCTKPFTILRYFVKGHNKLVRPIFLNLRQSISIT